MEIGEVGFFDDKQVKIVNNVTKNTDLLKRLKKSWEEKTIDYAAEKESYNKEVSNRKKKELEEQKKKELEEIKKAKELKKEMTFEYINEIGEETTNKDGKDIDDDFW